MQRFAIASEIERQLPERLSIGDFSGKDGDVFKKGSVQ
jgi:hypothetical protein